MWVPFAVLLGIFSLMLGGMVGHKIGKDECKTETAAPYSRPTPVVPNE